MSKAFDALGTEELRRTLLFVRAQAQPVTASRTAQALSLPVSVARWRLEKLVDAGLVRGAFERRRTGRPAKLYSAPPETAQIEFPARRYEKLVSLLLRRRTTRSLHEIGAAFGHELAESAGVRRGSGLEGLCRGLGKLGFQATVVSASEREAELASATCPLRPLVIADPAARAVDEGMWSGLVESALDGAHATCRTHGCLDGEGSCRIEVALAD